MRRWRMAGRGGADMSITTEEAERLAQTHDLVRFTLGMKTPEHDLTAAIRALAKGEGDE